MPCTALLALPRVLGGHGRPLRNCDNCATADGVCVITMTNPPVNSLATSVMKSVVQHVMQAENNPQIKAIIITGAGNFFCGGAEITEFEFATRQGIKNPGEMIHMAINAINDCKKPVVAAINGAALGGGLEVAMACHYRVVVKGAKLGLPEVNLGLLPGGQGTQRLVRLVGLQVALQMMLAGFPMPAEKLARTPLIDLAGVEAGKLLDQAARLALRSRVRRVSEMPIRTADKVMLQGGALDMALLQASKMRKGQPAPAAIGRCLQAALTAKEFKAGCVVEQEEFTKLMYSTESKALRSLFFAERLAARVRGIPKTVKAAPIKSVGVVGAGLMGGGITMCFVNKGVPVVLLDAKKEWLSKGMETIKKLYMGQVAKKKLAVDKAEDRMMLIKPSLDYKDLQNVDIVIEAVYENLALKQDIFRKLDAVCKPSALLCTNTSGLDINAIANVTSRPQSVMGTHFFSPANVMKLLENVRTAKASDQAIVTCMQMGKLIGKVCVLVGTCDGFVGNRMAGPYAAETRRLIEEGCHPERMDSLITSDKFGMAMGPVALGDLVGHDLFWRARKMSGDMKMDSKTAMGPHDLVDWLCERERFGQKAKKGFYTYVGREKFVDPEVMKGIQEVARKKGLTQRGNANISDEEVMERLFFPMINEGFKILEEGHAQRPTDIDIVYVYGYGFPPAKGGPMFYADNYIGLPKLLERLKVYDQEMKRRAQTNSNYRAYDYFEPAKLLQECVQKNMSLATLWRQKEKAAAATAAKL